MLGYGNYLGAVLARVTKRELNTNVPTIHPRLLITPKITTSYSRALPATRPSPSQGSLGHKRRLELHEGHEALAEETGRPGRLRTWRLSIDNRSLRPLMCYFYSHTPEPSPIRSTIVARIDRRSRIRNGHVSDIR